jgi:hypothetical protein
MTKIQFPATLDALVIISLFILGIIYAFSAKYFLVFNKRQVAAHIL